MNNGLVEASKIMNSEIKKNMAYFQYLSQISKTQFILKHFAPVVYE